MKSNVVLLAALIMLGCAAHQIGSSQTGEGLARVHGDLDSIGKTLDQAEPHADPVGKALIQNAKADAKDADDWTVVTIANYERYAKAKESEVKLAKVEAAQQRDRAIAAESTIGYRAEVWIKRLFWIITALIAFHIIGGLIGTIFAATPVGGAIGMLAKLVNPAGWLTWIISHAGKKVAVTSAVAAATGTDTLTAASIMAATKT